METVKLLSIVVPVYNAGEYFRPCLDSLVRQTMPSEDFEIIIIDDGSDDGSEDVCDEYAERHENIRCFHQPGSGFASAPRNKGIEHACGEYVLFHDADDILWPESCERLVRHALEWGSDVVGFTQRVVDPSTGSFAVVPTHSEQLYSCIPSGHRFMLPMVEVLDARKLFRLSTIKENGIRFANTYSEDFLFAIEVLLKANVVSFASDYPYVDYIQRNESIIHSNDLHPLKTFEKRLEGIQAMLDAIRDSHAECEAYPYLYEKIFGHSAYKLITTSMDRGWGNEVEKMPQLRMALLPYWDEEIAGHLKFTEHAVLDALMNERYGQIPEIRTLAKRVASSRRSHKVAVNSLEEKHPVKPIHDLLGRIPLFLERACLVCQLDKTLFSSVGILSTGKRDYVVGAYRANPAIAYIDSLCVRIHDSNDGWLEAELFEYVLPLKGDQELGGLWCVPVDEGLVGVDGLRYDLKMQVGTCEVTCNNVAASRGISTWLTSSDTSFNGRLTGLKALLECIRGAQTEELEEPLVALLLQKPTYAIITTSMDKRSWEEEKPLLPELKDTIEPLWRPGILDRLSYTERAVLECVIREDYDSIPNVRAARKAEAAKNAEAKGKTKAALKSDAASKTENNSMVRKFQSRFFKG
ncbi:Hyaluronan synthase [Slackia heliotrinireducens]|uniref:Glycosyl transferase n=1 Tax=Slackia heliotrinireducens (strain ATCC 29202 / DSM 20476 / NCTC 11029 / RHS 1) TaxID=471855 RepID=C7N6E3_SLAHD|nr:glycosyltransferase [Slackia heliotrinireducens]ACV22478.1 glycosyl transferase [Slackia heliotrinireducens DSM 20476]VEH00872.1 Hyaluronan synthase [Slackia heliotrinireducens]